MYVFLHITMNECTVYSPNKALAAEGFLLIFYRITFLFQDLPSSAKEPKPRYLSPGT